MLGRMAATSASISGTLSFLFTGLVWSTRTWEREPEAMDRWLTAPDSILTAAIAQPRGPRPSPAARAAGSHPCSPLAHGAHTVAGGSSEHGKCSSTITEFVGGLYGDQSWITRNDEGGPD